MVSNDNINASTTHFAAVTPDRTLENTKTAAITLSRSSSSHAITQNNSVVNFIDSTCNDKDHFISSESSTQHTFITPHVNADAVKVSSLILPKKIK